MGAVLDPVWGPYAGRDEAAQRLSRFVDKACGGGVGICWTVDGKLYPLRAPGVGSGLRDVVAFHWTHLPPPPPRPPTGFWERLKAGLVWCMEQEGKAALQEAESNRMMAQGIDRMLSRMVHSHRDDGLGVLFDIVAVGLSIALLPTMVGAAATVALYAGIFLLVADGTSYGMELAGNDEDAETVKRVTEPFRIVATIATLPDVGWNGVKLVKEMREIQAMRALDRTTAVAADAMAARSANAGRVARFQNIAERAHLRAQLRTEQLGAQMKLEVPSKGAGVGSTVMLAREEIMNDESLMHQIVRRLQIHCTALHK